MTAILYHVTLASNLDSILVEGLKPQVGARSAEAAEVMPAVYFFRTPDDCDNAMANWLGDCFDDEDVVILEVRIPGLEIEEDDSQYEYAYCASVAPECIRSVYDENWAPTEIGACQPTMRSQTPRLKS